MKKVIVILGVFIVIGIAYFVKSGIDFYRGIYKNGGQNKGFILPKPKTQYNILLLGYGGPGHDGPYLTDSIMVAHIDLSKNKVALLSLPRDVWVELPTKSKSDFHAKINSVYQLGLFPTEFPDVDTKTYPDATLVKKAIQDITGLEIDNYVTIDFNGFIKGIDILGGVTVDVQKTFDDYEYPIEDKVNDLCGKEEDFAKIEKFLKPGYSEDEKKEVLKDKPELEKFLKDITENPKDAFPCRYEHLHFDKGKVFMNGETALKYVRSRHSEQDGNDFARGARQQQFVKAVKEKVISLGMIPKIVPLLDELKNHIKTDISVDTMKKFMGEAKDAGNYKMININISDKDYLQSSYSDYGGYILIPRIGVDTWNEIHGVIQNAIFEITPTPQLKPTSRLSPTQSKLKN